MGDVCPPVQVAIRQEKIAMKTPEASEKILNREIASSKKEMQKEKQKEKKISKKEKEVKLPPPCSPNTCHFWLPLKRRYCKFSLKNPDDEFCANHTNSTNEKDER